MDPIPKKKPITRKKFEEKVDLYMQGLFGGMGRELLLPLLNKVYQEAKDAGVVTPEEAFSYADERKNYYKDLNMRQQMRAPFAGGGARPRTDLDRENLTSKKFGSYFKNHPDHKNIIFTEFKDKKTGKVFKKYGVRVRVQDKNVQKIGTTGEKYREIDSLDEAIKLRDEFRKENPKNIKTRDPKADYEDKQRRNRFIRERGGLPTSYTGTKAFPKGHASNIRGKNIITPSEIIYTPEKINLAMSGRNKTKIDKNNPAKSLDMRIQKTEEQMEKIKNTKMSSSKKKTELAKIDNKLVNYVAKSGGYKIATLSDGTKYGGVFQKLKSMDMFDEFKGKSEKEVNQFLNKYKNMKVTKNTTQADKDNIVKAKIFLENVKFAKQNAARGAGAPIGLNPGSLKPGALSPRMKLFRFSTGGPVKYGKYAKQISKLSS